MLAAPDHAMVRRMRHALGPGNSRDAGGQARGVPTGKAEEEEEEGRLAVLPRAHCPRLPAAAVSCSSDSALCHQGAAEGWPLASSSAAIGCLLHPARRRSRGNAGWRGSPSRWLGPRQRRLHSYARSGNRSSTGSRCPAGGMAPGLAGCLAEMAAWPRWPSPLARLHRSRATTGGKAGMRSQNADGAWSTGPGRRAAASQRGGIETKRAAAWGWRRNFGLGRQQSEAPFGRSGFALASSTEGLS